TRARHVAERLARDIARLPVHSEVVRRPSRAGAGVLLLLLPSIALAESALVFVSNEKSGTVSVIDPSAGAVVATVPVGKRPRGIQPSPAGRRVYVAVSCPGDRSKEAIV